MAAAQWSQSGGSAMESVNSMAAEMELGGEVEVGRLQVVRWQMVRSTHTT